MSASRPSHQMVFVPRRVLCSLLLAATAWLLIPGVASAHAHLVQADPAPGSAIAHAPAVAAFIFDEPLNPALTRVRIATAAGRTLVAGGHLASGHHDELWELPLPALANGTYSVFWTSESAIDGHVMSSFYTFQIAPAGAADSTGAVTGAAAGVYGGGSGGAADTLLSIGGGALVTALFTWLELLAQALWLGALLVDLAVLSPARRAAETAQGRLAWAATPRLWWLVRGAPVVTVWALLGEIISLALQGTGGDWGRALDPATLGGILSSQNGRFMVLRCLALLVALLVAGRVRVPTRAQRQRQTRAPAPLARGEATGRTHTLGIVAPSFAAPRWESVRLPLAVLAAAYMLLVAFSGHAADVTPAWLSYPIDWLHLVCTAVWAGGIATLAYGVLPLRRLLPADERAPAILFLLDRFSLVAFGAVAILLLSGFYNAVNHLATPATLVETAYGQLLILKGALVGLMLLLSVSHVWGLRPRIARAQRKAGRDASALAGVHDDLGTLAARLRLEAGVGAAILLVTALMGQTLPPNSAPALASAQPSIPASISGEATTGDLRGRLTVAPPAVGSASFRLQVWEKGTPVTGATGAAIMHLYPVAQPALRANLTPRAQGDTFSARGSLAATGAWRADVLVRTVAVNDYRTLPFTFTVGTGAAFLAPGENPAAVHIAVSPGRITAANTFTITGLPAPSVRLLSQSLDMNMGLLPYPATALGGGRWRVEGVYAPMNGRWGVSVQAQRDGTWTTVRQFIYQVPLSGPMRLLTPQASATAPAGSSATGQPAGLSGPFDVALARTLPYTALVTEMGSNGIRLLKTGALLPTGVQAHGVDVLDGTPYAYVTNFGAEPGTVSQIDMRTMRVVRTFTVGLGPAHIIFTPDERRAFVTDFRSSDLYMIDLSTGRTQRIAFPGDGACFEPHGGDISEDGRTLYVACAGGAWIYTVNTVTLKPEKPIITAPGAFGVAVDGPRHEVWVTNQTTNDVTVLDERTLKALATIPVGKGPALLVPAPDGKTVYVADQFANAVSVIDAASRRVTATIPVAAQPHGPDVTADGKYVYVASIGGNAVTVIRTSDNRVVAIIPSSVGSNEVAIAH